MTTKTRWDVEIDPALLETLVDLLQVLTYATEMPSWPTGDDDLAREFKPGCRALSARLRLLTPSADRLVRLILSRDEIKVLYVASFAGAMIAKQTTEGAIKKQIGALEPARLDALHQMLLMIGPMTKEPDDDAVRRN